MARSFLRLKRPVRSRTLAALTVSAVLVMPAAEATASPKPPAATTKKEIAKLNARVDKLVDRYNKAKTQLDAARKQLAVVNRQVAAETRLHQAHRARVAQLAASAYKNGTLDNSTLLAANNPDTALQQMSAFTKLSNSRVQELTAFLESAQRLRRQQTQARALLATVTATAATLKKQKAVVEKAIAKQRALLPKPETGGSIGGSYTGPASGPARKALQYAYAQLGKPYIWGGTGPKGYDCSGLTMMAWRAAGVSIPRVVPDQYDATRRVAFTDLQPGDLVFSKGLGHMGMYVGNGKMIHAPHTGTVVKIVPLSGYYRDTFLSGGRP